MRETALVGHYEVLLRRMFDEMVIPKDAGKIAEFYHPDFWMSTNQIEQRYAEFAADHTTYYQDPDRTYAIEIDERSIAEFDDGVSARVWITVGNASDDPTRIEVILIAKYVDDKIHRLWELTLPNWSTLKEFE